MIPTRIGQRSPGGYFAGINRIGNNAYAIIVSPNTTQRNGFVVKMTGSGTPGTQSANNGLANTISMDDSEHPAARYCLSLVVDGVNDFYLPSRDELELCYRNLKPVNWFNIDSKFNRISEGNLSLDVGTNPNSIPKGAGYTRTSPTQTRVLLFCVSNGEDFSCEPYISSTEYSKFPDRVLNQKFAYGVQDVQFKIFNNCNVRAVRRIQLT